MKIRNKSGLTIVEVTLAILILSCVIYIIMTALVTGNRIFGKGVLIENATLIAYDEVELLKAGVNSTEPFESREYEKEIKGRSFALIRNVLENSVMDSLTNNYPAKEIEIQVKNRIDSEETLLTFKLIQGYNLE